MSRFDSDNDAGPPPPPRRRETLPARFRQGASSPSAKPTYMNQPPPPRPAFHNDPQIPYYAPTYTGSHLPPPVLPPGYYLPPSMHYTAAVRPEMMAPNIGMYEPWAHPVRRSQVEDEGQGHQGDMYERRERVRERHRSRPRRRPLRRADSSRYSRSSDSESSDDDYGEGESGRLQRELRRLQLSRPDEENNSPFVYSFSLSRSIRGLSTNDSRNAEDDFSEKTEEEAGPQRDSRRPKITHVFESQYTGESCIGGLHTAKLTAVVSTKIQYQPLFRWMHFTQTSMDFDDFSNQASCIPDLTNVERKGIADILARVKRKFVKSIQTSSGRYVQKMEPTCIQHTLPSDGSSKGQTITPRTVTWICLPYFSLEPYSGLRSAKGSSDFPIQTILQAQFSRTTQTRDMQQAVCQNNKGPAGLCFHIAQLWCLVLDNALLLTYSRVTEENLCAGLISKDTNPIQEKAEDQMKARFSVRYQGSVMWSIPVEECQTWLEFVSHFREFWPRPMVFFRHRRQVTADEWPKIWYLAKRVNTRIILDMALGASPNPPPRGLLKPLRLTEKVEERVVSGSQSQPEARTQESEQSSLGRKGKAQSAPESATSAPDFSIFACLEGVTRTDLSSVDQSALDDHMREVEGYLSQMTSFSDRRVYRDCPKASRKSVYELLEKQGSDLSNSANAQSTQQGEYEDRIDVFNAAEVIFNFFFPPHVNTPTTDKYWGAVRHLVESSPEGDSLNDTSHFISRSSLRFIRSQLRNLTITLTMFTDIFGHSRKADRMKIAVPDELVQAWIHLIMSLIYFPKDQYKSELIMDDATMLIDEGVNEIVKSMSQKSLLDKSAILPLEIVSLMSLKLLEDITPGLPDISKTYSSYMDSVESDIATKPSDRSHEHRISLLKQEISIIRKTIEAQKSIFESLVRYSDSLNRSARARAGQGRSPEIVETINRSRSRDRSYSTTHHMPREEVTIYDKSRDILVERSHSYHDREPYYEDRRGYNTSADSTTDFKLTSTDPGGFRELLLQECVQLLNRRKEEFWEFSCQADLLEEENRNKVDTTKDRQELAIYAFTIVTIVFLPLSSVASIFGMNTNDVRNMELDQWAYWAVAVPVTVVVIFLGLLWTGELGNILRWVASFGPQTEGYSTIPDDMYREARDMSRERPRSRTPPRTLRPLPPGRVVLRARPVDHLSSSRYEGY